VTNGTPDVTRGEFNMLKDKVDSNERRLESIDDHGTRGVGTLQTQIVELVKDVTELKTDLTRFIAEHSKTHKQESDERTSSRRWMIGMAVGAITMLAAVLTVVVEILFRMHGG